MKANKGYISSHYQSYFFGMHVCRGHSIHRHPFLHFSFIEQSRKACQMIRENLKALEIDDGFKVLEMDLIKGLNIVEAAFDIAFIDPPYERDDLYAACLNKFGNAPLLAPDGLLIVEHSKRKELPDSAGSIRKIRSLVQGDAALAFYTA